MSGSLLRLFERNRGASDRVGSGRDRFAELPQSSGGVAGSSSVGSGAASGGSSSGRGSGVGAGSGGVGSGGATGGGGAAGGGNAGGGGNGGGNGNGNGGGNGGGNGNGKGGKVLTARLSSGTSRRTRRRASVPGPTRRLSVRSRKASAATVARSSCRWRAKSISAR